MTCFCAFRKNLREVLQLGARVSLKQRGRQGTETFFSFPGPSHTQPPGFTGGPRILNTRGDLLRPLLLPACLSVKPEAPHKFLSHGLSH